MLHCSGRLVKLKFCLFSLSSWWSLWICSLWTPGQCGDRYVESFCVLPTLVPWCILSVLLTCSLIHHRLCKEFGSGRTICDFFPFLKSPFSYRIATICLCTCTTVIVGKCTLSVLKHLTDFLGLIQVHLAPWSLLWYHPLQRELQPEFSLPLPVHVVFCLALVTELNELLIEGMPCLFIQVVSLWG